MSTIRVDNFGPSAGGTTYSARGIAKAWVRVKGTATVTIDDSLNTSSVTDNGLGDYTTNFNNSFDNTNYGFVGMGGLNTTSLVCITQPMNLTFPAVSSTRHQSARIDATLVDARIVNVAYLGDLA